MMSEKREMNRRSAEMNRRFKKFFRRFIFLNQPFIFAKRRFTEIPLLITELRAAKFLFGTLFGRFSMGLTIALLFVACSGKPDGRQQNDWAEEEVQHLSEQEFTDKFGTYDISTYSFEYRGEKPVVIDFYALWCGPCKLLAPVMEELASEYKGRVDFYKVDIDTEKQIANRYGISSIPTLFFISSNGEARVACGLMSKPELKAVIDKMLSE